MADKRRVRQEIKRLQQVRTWQLVVLLMIAGFIAATFLRLNNIGMVERRNAVLAADKSGDASVIVNRLHDLQAYTAAHLNANTGVFYLDNQYKRDVASAVNSASGDNNPYGNINATVDKICRSRFSHYSQAWVQCFADELAKYPPAPNPADTAKLPSADLYRYDFASPYWSPDCAGWALVVCVVLVLLIIVRLVGYLVLKMLLKRHYRGI